MVIISEKWGNIEYQVEDIISFEQGIPGFEHLKEYVIIPLEDTPFLCMQALSDSAVSFILVNPFDFFKTYEFFLGENVKEEMGITDDTSLSIYCIIKLVNNVQDATINLASPIIINCMNNKGKQYIIPEGTYKVNQPLFKALPSS